MRDTSRGALGGARGAAGAVLSSQKLQNQVTNEKPVRCSVLLPTGPSLSLAFPAGMAGSRSPHLPLLHMSGCSCLAHHGPARQPMQTQAGRQAGSGQEGGTRSAPWTSTQAGAALASHGSFIHPGVGRHPRQKSAHAGQGSLLGTLAWGLSARAQRVFPMSLLNRGWQKSRHMPAAPESELHVAAAEKQQPGHAARGLSNTQGTVHLRCQRSALHPPRVRWQTVGRTEGTCHHPHGLSKDVCRRAALARSDALCLSASVVGAYTAKLAKNNNNNNNKARLESEIQSER